MAMETLNYILTRDSKHSDAKLAADDAAASHFDKCTELLKGIPGNAEVTRLLDAATGVDEAKCNPLENKIIGLAKSGDLKAAQATFERDYIPARTELETKIDAFQTALEKKEKDLADTANAAASRAIGFCTLLLIALTLIPMAITFGVCKSIVGSIRGLMAACGLLADGDLTATVDVKAKDECGEMATTFNA